MKHTWNKISIGWVRVLLLPAMLLLTPFLIFLEHFFYDWSDTGTLCSLAMIIGVSVLCSSLMMAGGRISHSLIVAGLLTFFIDIQFEWIEGADLLAKYLWLGIAIGVFTISWVLKEHFFQIATVIFTVFFIVTLGQVLLTKSTYDLQFEKLAPKAGGKSLPRIIHLVLDAHIGLEGIPLDTSIGQDMKAALKSFYRENGFMVFGGAYSHYPLTSRSIPHFLNFSSTPYETTPEGAPLWGGDEPHKLFHNHYFELLSSQGYRINVLANSLHLDYCSESKIVIQNCVERALSGMKHLKGSDIALKDKLRVVFSHFFSLGYTVKGIRYAYGPIKGALSDNGIDLPPWNWGTRPPLMPLTSLDILDILSEKISTLPNGHFLYSHLMVPHQPYVLRSDCSLNPSPNHWKNNGDSGLEQKNTIASREDRYGLYFQQMKCVYKKLNTLFDHMRKIGIYEDSIIILHGDHGSRISRFEFRSKHLKQLSKTDFEDQYSTLFAVKLPKFKEYYSLRRQPIEELLARTIFPNVPIMSHTQEIKPFIYLRGQGREPIDFP